MAESQLPEAFSKQMKEHLGAEEFLLFERALDRDPKTSIRVNPFKPKPDFKEAEQVPWEPEGLYLSERPSFTLDPRFHGGAYYVQESSSMFVSYILKCINAPTDGIFLDLAAAPGGKSTLLSSFLGRSGFLVANEVIKTRASILKENLVKWGIGNTMVTQNDPEHFSELHGFFDLVLIDAPCSGEGMFRKDPKAREEWSQEHVHICAARQSRILMESAGLVKAGGYLLYSTCTFNERENEEMVRLVVSEFAYEPVRIPLEPAWNIVESSVQTDEGVFFGYRFFPHLVNGEGFFISVLKRSDDAAILAQKKAKEFKHPFLKQLGKTESTAIRERLELPPSSVFYKLQDSIFWLNADFQHHFEFLTRFLNIKYFGVELGQFSKDQFLPNHEWALSIFPKKGFPTLDLAISQSLAFLRKEDLTVPDSIPEGWVLITYENLPLGWIKNLGNRINNYYPKEWRIRMKNEENG